MPSVGKKKFPYTRSGQKAARRYAKATGQPVSNSRGQGGVKYQHSPIPGRPGRVPKGRFGPKPRSLPPVPGRSAAPRKRRPQVGPGTGIGGGPRPLSRPSNAINRRRRRIGMGDPTVRPAANRRRRNY